MVLVIAIDEDVDLTIDTNKIYLLENRMSKVYRIFEYGARENEYWEISEPNFKWLQNKMLEEQEYKNEINKINS